MVFVNLITIVLVNLSVRFNASEEIFVELSRSYNVITLVLATICLLIRVFCHDMLKCFFDDIFSATSM